MTSVPNAYASTRLQYRLSQEQWATAFGVARSTVSAWEIGSAEPPPAAQGAYRALQEPIRRADLAELERLRGELLRIGARAEEEAERLNRGRAQGSAIVDVVAVAVGAIAVGLLLGLLFADDKRTDKRTERRS